jgi:O-methyltransferase involved in polyketide biosynthesis
MSTIENVTGTAFVVAEFRADENTGANGFDFDLPTYVIWEGNTMYLPLETSQLAT